jgi:hypothetical protein
MAGQPDPLAAIQRSSSTTSGALGVARTAKRCSAGNPLISPSISKIASIRRTAATASGARCVETDSPKTVGAFGGVPVHATAQCSSGPALRHGQQPGEVISPHPLSCEVNVLRPPELQHAGQRGDSNGPPRGCARLGGARGGCRQRKSFGLTFRSTSLARQALLSVLTAPPGSLPRLAPSAELAAVQASRQARCDPERRRPWPISKPPSKRRAISRPVPARRTSRLAIARREGAIRGQGLGRRRPRSTR